MRKIEIAMNLAIARCSNWRDETTEVVSEQEYAVVYLYGNKIAEVGEDYIKLFDGGCRSATTKSRLNAILSENGIGDEKIYQRAGVWRIKYDKKDEVFINGMKI